MERTHWIVVGIDFSEGSARALEHAIELAADTGASVACVHAYEDPPGTPLLADRGCALRAQLDEFVATSGALGKGVHVEAMLRRGAAWEKLLNVACDLGAESIVVGARGAHEAPHQFFLGTVATRVAAMSTRTVLIVPGLAPVGSR